MKLGTRLATFGFGLLTGCTALPVIDAKVCGNAVLEPAAHEDCDTFVGRDAPPGAVCRAPGSIGECHYDCSVGADNERAVCPAGMGCAADGICRRATDAFTAPVRLSSDPSSWLSALDFDGDGRLELLSTEPADQLEEARFRLHYFDAAGGLSETRTFPRITTRPIAAELDGEPGTDLLFSNLRIGMLPGRADRDWVPAAFSSYVLPNSGVRAVGVRDDLVAGVSALVALTTLDGVSGVYAPTSLDEGGLKLLAPFSSPLERLAGAPLGADLVTGGASPCKELTFAFRGDSSFRVLDLCQLGEAGEAEVAWRDQPQEQVVSLPSGVIIDGGPLVADVDGDGHLDVLIGADQHTYVARGDGTHLEPTAQGPLSLPLFGTEDLTVEPPLALAAGDVSGDGIADFVVPDGVFSSRTSLVDGKVSYFPSYANTAEPWTMAEVGDLNGNRLPDIVAASAGAPGLTFLNGTGAPHQVAARLSSHGPVRFLTTGDFDGDLIDDVAFVEDGSPSQVAAELSVAFGQRDGIPLAATRIAQLNGVQQLSRHHEIGLDSLFAASTELSDAEPRSTLTLFDGNPDRLPFAPYELVSFSRDRRVEQEMALALAVGVFTADGAEDVVALGVSHLTGAWDLWLIPSIGGQKQPPQLLSSAAPVAAHPITQLGPSSFKLSVASAAGDLEGDAFDEALWLMPLDAMQAGATAGCVLLRYDIDGGSAEATVKSELTFDEPCPSPELAVRDLDADGDQDLLLLLGDPERGQQRLEVLWNDGGGRFSLENRSILGDSKQHDVLAFSVFPTPPQRPGQPPVAPRVAFVTASTLHVASLSAGLHTYDSLVSVGGFHDARAVTVIDPNADKVSDVAVADSEGLWLVGAKLQ